MPSAASDLLGVLDKLRISRDTGLDIKDPDIFSHVGMIAILRAAVMA